MKRCLLRLTIAAIAGPAASRGNPRGIQKRDPTVARDDGTAAGRNSAFHFRTLDLLSCRAGEAAPIMRWGGARSGRTGVFGWYEVCPHGNRQFHRPHEGTMITRND